MRQLFSFKKKDEKTMLFLIGLFALVNLIWAYYSPNTWDDDCPNRFFNTQHALSDPKQFVLLWNRPLFVLIFALPTQLGAWTIPVIQTFFSVLAGVSLYQVAKHYNLKYAYLAFPLLALQPFVFGVSKYAMTEPLAITLICLSLYFQVQKKWTAFVIAGGLIPLARMELVALFPFWVLPLITHKKYKEILYLGIPGVLWAIAGGILHGDLMWIINEAFFKTKENRYGHQEWHTYTGRYFYVVGPVLSLFGALGLFNIWTKKHARTFILLPFVLGFSLYTIFSWKLDMGNAAGFLRNIIPVSPYLAIIALFGINSWRSILGRKKINLKALPPKLGQKRLFAYKKYNANISNTVFYGIIVFSSAILTSYVFFSKHLKSHHTKEDKVEDFSIFFTQIGITVLCLLLLFLSRKVSKKLLPIGVVAFLFGFTLIVEHPMANANEERTIVAKAAEFYKQSEFATRKTYVNHPWFFWAGGMNKFDENKYRVKLDSIKKANIGDVVIYDTHYSHRLSGDVPMSYMTKQKDWLSVSLLKTPSNSFYIAMYEKIGDSTDLIGVHDKYIASVDSLDASAFYMKGMTYINKIKNRELAKKELKHAISIDSLMPDCYYALGQLSYFEKNFDEALGYFNKAVEINENHTNSLLQIGIVQFSKKQFKKARKSFRAVAELTKPSEKRPVINNQYLMAKRNEGKCFYQEKNYKRAGEVFRHIISTKKGLGEDYYNLGYCYAQLKDNGNACNAFKNAAKKGMKQANQLIPQVCK